LDEKAYFLLFLVIARRPPGGGCRGNLIESHKAKRLLRSARNDSITQNLPVSFRHEFFGARWIRIPPVAANVSENDIGHSNERIFPQFLEIGSIIS